MMGFEAQLTRKIIDEFFYSPNAPQPFAAALEWGSILSDWDAARGLKPPKPVQQVAVVPAVKKTPASARPVRDEEADVGKFSL